MDILVRDTGLAVLDGGLATHLEDALGRSEISSSPLWSASLLQSSEGQEAIVQAHLDFLHAGAHVISTSTYQASFVTLVQQARLTTEEATELLIQSVRLAQQARHTFVQSRSHRSHAPLICLGLGPYGAALSNGAEYTGVYDSDYDGGDHQQKPDAGRRPPYDLEQFHFDRLAAIASSSAWSDVDVIAFETVPRLDEAQAARRALDRLYKTVPDCSVKPAFVSFVFPNGRTLPFPPAAAAAAEEEQLSQIVESTLLPADGLRPFDGIGVNCTKPFYLSHLASRLSKAVSEAQRSSSRAKKPYLFLYPDGGLTWDGIKREWNKADSSQASTWSETVLAAAQEALDSSAWAGCFVGGCCKATTSDIKALRAGIDAKVVNKEG